MGVAFVLSTAVKTSNYGNTALIPFSLILFRDPGLLNLPKGQLCRNVLFVFLLSVIICDNLEGDRPSGNLAKLGLQITKLP